MSTTRAFGIGVFAVLGLVAAIHTNSGTIALLWVAATLGILVVTALFAGGTVIGALFSRR